MKIVLGYSGGLDTSVIVPWPKVTYGAEVVCMAGDVGQPGGLEEKAIRTGASSFLGEDLRKEFVEEFVNFLSVAVGCCGGDTGCGVNFRSGSRDS